MAREDIYKVARALSRNSSCDSAWAPFGYLLGP